MVQHLFAFGGGLLGDAGADLGRGIEDTAVVADLRQPSKAADDSGGCESLEVSVVDLGGESGGADLIEANVLVEVDGKPVRADGAVEGHEHFALLRIADALYCADHPRSLRHQKMLVVM